jgi:predicted RNA-binding protein with EMAP domain
MTQREFNEDILLRLENIQKRLPNGEITSLIQTMKEMKEDISEMKYTLLNPETGVIVKTNKNMEKAQNLEERLEELEDEILAVPDLIRFRENVTKALWILFSSIVLIASAMLTGKG